MKIDVDKYLNNRIKVKYWKPLKNLFELDSRSDIRRWMRIYFPGTSEDEHIALRDAARKEFDSLQTQWHDVADKECRRLFKRPWEFHDYKVSGIGRSEFSERVKQQLRDIVDKENIYRDIRWAHNQMLKAKNRN